MAEPFDAVQYIEHLKTRWRLFAIGMIASVALALGGSLLQTRLYTAVARIVIDPPASVDPRVSMAVSPIYLESLRTYEHFASSDSLFQKALEKFQLRKSEPKRTLESWKKQVLRVEIPRNTKILEVHVTLPDPRIAHSLAGFLAEETVRMNQTVNVEGDQALTVATERELTRADQERDRAREAYLTSTRTESVEAIEANLQSLKSRRFAVERDLLDAETTLAETPEASTVRTIEARARHLRGERDRLREEISRGGSELATRTARLEEARNRLRAAEAAYEAIEARLREARGVVGFRGERLRVIDPGVVPERPSSPNPPLNVVIAALVALLLVLLYSSFEFGVQRRGIQPVAIPLRVANRD
jgi:uncharacterized protein involved in exopolysaccharide biosynthesis